MIKYRICLLGYQKLTELARAALKSLDLPDTEVRIAECNVETLQKTVEQAITEGYDSFIAGSANAAEFRRHFKSHLTEIALRPIDYLSAIKKAQTLGQSPVLVLYRYGRTVDLPMLEYLSGISLETIVYEDSADLQDGILAAKGDVIVGAGHANELALELGRKAVLLYPGADSVKNAILRARAMAVELEKEIRKSCTIEAILGSAPIGLIVSDPGGRITLFNRAARNYSMVGNARLLGKSLSEVLPPLSPEAFLRSGEQETDQRRLINGAMMRTVQVRITDREEMVGVLTTIYPDNSRRSNQSTDAAEKFRAYGTWEDAIGSSPAITSFIREAKATSDAGYPLAIIGEPGTSKTFYAGCIHNGSVNAKSPCVTINASALPDQEVSRVLFGSEDAAGVRPGLLELAGSGTVILRNLPLASKIVQNALLLAITKQQFLRLGGLTPVPFKARVITIADSDDSEGILLPLWHTLSVLTLHVPPLRERAQDIPALFAHLAAQDASLSSQRRTLKADSELLQYYSWPGNMLELQAACSRYAFLLSKATRPTPAARHLLLIQAIGEDNLFAEVLRRHPALAQIRDTGGKAAEKIPAEKLLAGIADLKTILKYNNETIARKLSVGRTTLWRILKES